MFYVIVFISQQSAADFKFGQASGLSRPNTISRHHLDTVSNDDLYAANFAAELLCLRDHTLTNDVVLNKDDLNDLLSTTIMYSAVIMTMRSLRELHYQYQ